jgi:hypothetical protein
MIECKKLPSYVQVADFNLWLKGSGWIRGVPDLGKWGVK